MTSVIRAEENMNHLWYESVTAASKVSTRS